VGPRRLEMFKKLGAATVGDLVSLFPRRYEDRRNIKKICNLVPGQPAVVFAEAESIERRRTSKPGLELVVCTMNDGTGSLDVSWFNRKGLEYALKEGTSAVLYGVPSMRSDTLEMSNPDFEVVKDEQDAQNFTGIVPVYPSTAGIPMRWFKHLMDHLLEKALPLISETIPDEILKKRDLISLFEAVRAMHRPHSPDEWKQARRRLAYEELLVVQTGLALRRQKLKKKKAAANITGKGKIYRRFRESLPFKLTVSQERALDEILKDTSSGEPMSRLLQGDVGSGKTLVALGLAAASSDAGVQTAIMAPTEVLAAQLYAEAQKYLEPLGIKCVLLKGGQKAVERRDILASLLDCSSLVAVGTQALIESGAVFKKLGTVVIDEQHRFGVAQRASMLMHGRAPHLLMMSATPIPRTLTLCAFGDLDISLLTDKPQGHAGTETRIIDMHKMRTLLQFIIDEAGRGGRIFWICPRVEDEGAGDVISAEKRFEFVEKHLGRLGVGLLHGRMENSEKDSVLAKFRSGEIKVLIGTTVVEVGVDVPEASVMIIESPERFGLSQLHQLRGRVGRGGRRGVCVMLVKEMTGEIPERLDIMLKTDDGFKIAEADLALRGSGEISGVSQHGLAEFHVADLKIDAKLLDEAREDAAEWIKKDPELENSPEFKQKIETFFARAAENIDQ